MVVQVGALQLAEPADDDLRVLVVPASDAELVEILEQLLRADRLQVVLVDHAPDVVRRRHVPQRHQDVVDHVAFREEREHATQEHLDGGGGPADLGPSRGRDGVVPALVAEDRVVASEASGDRVHADLHGRLETHEPAAFPVLSLRHHLQHLLLVFLPLDGLIDQELADRRCAFAGRFVYAAARADDFVVDEPDEHTEVVRLDLDVAGFDGMDVGHLLGFV